LSGAMAVAEHLVQLGHRQIAVIAGHPRASTSISRTAGFEGKLAELGLTLEPHLRLCADYRYDLAYESMTSLLSLPSPPTAVFCHNDLMAFGAVNAALGAGLRVPEDISVVGFDDVPLAGWESMELTTVRQPVPEMAVAAVGLLESRLADPRCEARHLVFPSSLVVRSTTGPVTSSQRRSRRRSARWTPAPREEVERR
jgi:LacI family transcriptional regulator